METEILKAIELLKAGKTGKVSKTIFTVENAVVFRDVKETSLGNIQNLQEVIAIKTNSGVILGNSSRMQVLEDQRYKLKIQPATIQRILSDHITMIPFSVFQEAGLDLLSCEIVDSGPAETLKEYANNSTVVTIDRHFTGARLFKALTKNRGNGIPYEATYFLCDVDRREVEHNIINFFLAELPKKCDTIAEAYEMLKPDEVKQAEKNGVKVERQGEFFFIKDSGFMVDLAERYNKAHEIRQIRVGNSRPNSVEHGIEVEGTFYVRGKISHTGREHADLFLPPMHWFKVVPNTSKANFQLTGDID